MTTEDKKPSDETSFSEESARAFCGDLSQTVDTLIEVLNKETQLIKAAKLTAAADLSGEKAVASERYMKAHGTLKRSGSELSGLVPDEIDHLRERHQALESAISANLAVLATARTVSETLIKGIGDIVSKHRGRTETYGDNGRQTVRKQDDTPLSCNIAL